MGVKTLTWMKSPSTEVGTCACLRCVADHTWWSHMILDDHDNDRSSFQNTSSNHLEFANKNIHAWKSPKGCQTSHCIKFHASRYFKFWIPPWLWYHRPNCLTSPCVPPRCFANCWGTAVAPGAVNLCQSRRCACNVWIEKACRWTRGKITDPDGAEKS